MSRPSAEDNLVQRLQRKSQKHNNTNHKYTNKGIEDDLVETRTATYEIPEADRTTLAHGETHPHNHENELAFQEKYMKWWNDWEASL